jgi:hypothetical protein
MTAPAAPVIYSRQNSGFVVLRWREVDGATDYNIYMGDTTAPTGIEDSVSDAEVEPNGWFIWTSVEQIGQVHVRVTALNALAEESAYSNERYHYMNSESDPMRIPTSITHALDMQR